MPETYLDVDSPDTPVEYVSEGLPLSASEFTAVKESKNVDFLDAKLYALTSGEHSTKAIHPKNAFFSTAGVEIVVRYHISSIVDSPARVMLEEIAEEAQERKLATIRVARLAEAEELEAQAKKLREQFGI